MFTDQERTHRHSSMAARKSHCTWKFAAPLEKQPGRYGWWYVECPLDVVALFGMRGEVRVKCRFNGIEVDRALMPTRSGFHILAMNALLRKKAGVDRPGDIVEVELWKDPTAQRIMVPEELAATLAFMPEMNAAWERLTAGRRRDICTWIASAKRAETRERRTVATVRRWEQGEHPFGTAPWMR